MNYMIHYNPRWPSVPTKIPSDIPKFEAKSGEESLLPGDHIMTFHLWCSSNLLDKTPFDYDYSNTTSLGALLNGIES
jgi:hypothetical protein